MKFAIQPGGTGGWVVASPRAAAARASEVTGKQVGPRSLRILSDAERAVMGVRRLVDNRPGSGRYSDAVPGTITPTADHAIQQYSVQDLDLSRAVAAAVSYLDQRAEQARSVGVLVTTTGPNADTYRFTSDVVSLVTYNTVSNGTYNPGIRWLCTRESDGTEQRVSLNASQWAQLLAGCGDLLISALARRSELMTQVEAAADLAALRAIDLDAGWPS